MNMMLQNSQSFKFVIILILKPKGSGDKYLKLLGEILIDDMEFNDDEILRYSSLSVNCVSYSISFDFPVFNIDAI